MNFATLFQGIGTLFYQEPAISITRVALIIFGIVLVYLGKKGTLEPLVMVPMGFGMAAVNAGVLFLSANETGTMFLDPLVTETNELMSLLQIDFLQPIYTFTFSNGLIACIIFMGIGVISDVGNVLRYPFISMFIALCAEIGCIIVFPIAVAMGLDFGSAAAVSTIGGADGPMVLFTSLILAPELFVPITIVAYLYLSLTYAGYPFLIRLLIPKEYRGIVVKNSKKTNITSNQKLTFDLIAGTLLCLLFPMAAPLFLSFFLGNAIKESGITKYIELLENTFLYMGTFFLGLMLGVLCEASSILDPKVLLLLVLGLIALLFSGIGGIIGGYIVFLVTKKNFNPTIGIAGVSCLPTTAKIAQKEVMKINKRSIILQYAMGASVCGVITSAIMAGIFITLIPNL